jgi:predicted phage tail protein
MTEHKRNLTDDDVSALADEMEKRMVNRFYGNLGRGVWGIVWKAVVIAIVGVAAYGAIRGH